MARQARFNRDNTRYGKRHKPGVMNRTERAYADLLEGQRLAGDIIGWLFEPMKFRLADRCFYTPDFMIFHNDQTLEFVDVKGGGPINEGAIIKGKCAAEAYWFFKFTMAERLPDRSGWKRTEF
ncbi:MAG: hypothetical protein AB7U73_08280 [Pirellulales bacterium]